MNALAIVNTLSGCGRGAGRAEVLEAVGRIAAKVVVTESAGHARVLATGAGAYDGVIVVGGDGTLLEVINGMDRSRQWLGIVPTGRGNSLARDLAVYPVSHGVDVLRAGHSGCIDLMAVTFDDERARREMRLAGSTVAVGYPARVVREAVRWRRLGARAYAVAAACTRPEFSSLRLQVDDGARASLRASGVIVNNTRHLASFVGLPRASCRDGRMDVMVMRAGVVGQALHNLSALSNLHWYTPAGIRQGSVVSIALDAPQALMIDGELFPGVVHVEVEARPAAVRVVHGLRS